MKNLKVFTLITVVLLLGGCTNNQGVSLVKQAQEYEIQVQEYKTQAGKYEAQAQELEKLLVEEKDQKTLLQQENEALEDAIKGMKDRELLVVRARDDYLHFVYVEKDNAYQNVTIIGEDRDGLLENDQFSSIDLGSDSTGDVLAITVLGSIYQVELVKVEYNLETDKLEVKSTIDSIEEVRNQKVKIHSNFPEGIPNEMLRWQNKEGEKFSYVISDDGYGFGGVIIWNK